MEKNGNVSTASIWIFVRKRTAFVLEKYNDKVWGKAGEGLLKAWRGWDATEDSGGNICLLFWRRWKMREVKEKLRWWILKIGWRLCSRRWPFLVITLNLQKMQQQKMYTVHAVSRLLWKLMKGLCFASGVSWSFKIQNKRTLVSDGLDKQEKEARRTCRSYGAGS